MLFYSNLDATLFLKCPEMLIVAEGVYRGKIVSFHEKQVSQQQCRASIAAISIHMIIPKYLSQHFIVNLVQTFPVSPYKDSPLKFSPKIVNGFTLQSTFSQQSEINSLSVNITYNKVTTGIGDVRVLHGPALKSSYLQPNWRLCLIFYIEFITSDAKVTKMSSKLNAHLTRFIFARRIKRGRYISLLLWVKSFHRIHPRNSHLKLFSRNINSRSTTTAFG